MTKSGDVRSSSSAVAAMHGGRLTLCSRSTVQGCRSRPLAMDAPSLRGDLLKHAVRGCDEALRIQVHSLAESQGRGAAFAKVRARVNFVAAADKAAHSLQVFGRAKAALDIAT